MSAAPLEKYYQAVSQEGPVGDDEAIVLINTDRVDRDHEVVVPSGLRQDDYGRNRVVMFAHSRGTPGDGKAALPIARNLWIKPTPDGRGLIARHKFDIENELGRDICRQVKKDFLGSHSVKFLPIRWGPPTRAEIAKNPSWADAKTVYREWSLLEYSVLVFPSNPDAITLIKGAKPMGEAITELPVTLKFSPEAEEFVAPQEEAKELIARACTIEAIFKGFENQAEQKGEKLGDIRSALLRPIVDALTSSLNGYLWGVIYDWREEPGTYSDRIGAACAEFCEAAILSFEAFEPLKLKTEKNLKMEVLAKGMSFEAIDLFGDPALILEEALIKAMTKKEANPDDDVSDEVEEKAAKVDTEDDGEEDEEPEIKPGDHVKCKAPHCKGYGKVASVHTKDMVPDVEDDIMGSKGDPACRVKMYKKMGDGWQPTAHHRGMSLKHCEKCAPLKTPSKAKAIQEKEEPGERIWNDQEMAVAVDMIRSTPDYKKSLERTVLDKMAVLLGRV